MDYLKLPDSDKPSAFAGITGSANNSSPFKPEQNAFNDAEITTLFANSIPGSTGVSIMDFKPITEWAPVNSLTYNSDLLWADNTPKYIRDTLTNRAYLNESKWCIRKKCCLLILGTPIIHTIISLEFTAFRILKLISFAHFWMNVNKEEPYSIKERSSCAGKDLARVLTRPFHLIALQLSAIYGVISPCNGRKLYASFERLLPESFFLAPCFQPNASSHFFGGDVKNKNAF